MYLKSLSLIGFKSFAEKTSLAFLPGVTAIVGPNGCGKSNVADAVRWVLGEQSAKALRGSEMADVIFNGTEGRKAIGLAEVSLTFADVNPKTLSLAGVSLDFSEVTITRRVYRDGTSEYLINKTQCRLRDIQTMFMDTGIGRSSYSLMAQGQIDQILSARPEDRRTIFEEAAGINKYKHQKKEALRKLEYTEANLVRITDIIKEVKRQIISLQRQAGKARRYKEIFDELKSLDTKLARHKFDLLIDEIKSLEDEVAAIAARSHEYESKINEQEQHIVDLRATLAEIEQAVHEAIRHQHELKGESDRNQHRIDSNTERIAEFEQLIENHRRETAGAEERIRVQDEDLSRLNAEFSRIKTALVDEQAKLEARQEAVKELDSKLVQKNAVLSELKTALMKHESEAVNCRNELAALDHKKKHDIIRSERLSTEKMQLEEQSSSLEERLNSFTQGLEELKGAVEFLRTTFKSKEEELSVHIQQCSVATQSHQQATTELSTKSARLEVLEKFFAAPGGQTTLGSILEVDAPYGAAIEAAISHAIRTILVDDIQAVRKIFETTIHNASVAALDLPSVPGQNSVTEIPHGAEALAIKVVRLKDSRFEPLLQSLLRNVVITKDLDGALSLRSNHPHVAVATQSGEFIDGHGILSAVSSSHIAEISQLSKDVSELRKRISHLTATKAELDEQKTCLDSDCSRLRSELHEKEVSLASKEGELSAIRTEQRDMQSKIHTIVFEVSSIEKQDAEEQEQRTELTTKLNEAEASEEQVEEKLQTALAAVEELQAEKEESFQLLTEQRVTAAGIHHKHDAIQSQREPIAGRIRDLQERIQICSDETAAYSAKIQVFRDENAASTSCIEQLAATREESQQHLAEVQQRRAAAAARIDDAENALRSLRKQASQALQDKSGFDLALAQKQMAIQQIKDRITQKYQINIEDVQGDTISITVTDHGPSVTEEVPLQSDWVSIETQVTELQSRLDSMGTVNVDAIQEYDELEERNQFLTQQNDDLIQAKDQLLQVIGKINTTTKQLFGETFEKVRINFQHMYSELFGGGKADLRLIDESDPLESGIDIVAKPPGKQLQNITLLSGGEKTLTATALLFAVYMVKPSPFCVLDELDAPLDESNINRFIRILQRFVSQSQFVIITHNKRTIGMADALYGITMEEHGVSKVVSVKFSQTEGSGRKNLEKEREDQEDRIDGGAVLRKDILPHEEPLHNELLAQKEATVASISEGESDEPPFPTES